MLLMQRLNTTSIPSRANFLLGRTSTKSAVLTEPQTGPPSLHFPCEVHPCCRMATEELTAISKQLHSQAQIIESLSQAVCRLKQEKELQQQSISHLEEEVGRLQHNPQGGLESGPACKMEGLKSELRSLRQQMFLQSDGDCTPDPFSSLGIMQDMLESKKVMWQEYECLKREIEQLKRKLDRQEENLFNQVSATHEIKRTQNRYCKMLEDLLNSHKTQTQDLDKTKNETQNTLQELNYVKSTVTDLKEQVKSLHLEDTIHKIPLKDKASHPKRNKDLLLHDDVFSSFLSDDSVSEFSLTDVSSDELSSEPEIAYMADDRISQPSLEEGTSGGAVGGVLEGAELTSGGAVGGGLEGAELSSDLSVSLPELNLSDL
uniref:Uncharacterized protein n=1 Tax=Salvator merianae TaxID=96440 RepID=A0A8D0DYJ9_SALMN